MLFNCFLTTIDKLICKYLGLDQEEVRPSTIELNKNKILIGSTISYKRHFFYDKWFDLKKINKTNQTKLGLAAGKALAKNLVIYFSE